MLTIIEGDQSVVAYKYKKKNKGYKKREELLALMEALREVPFDQVGDPTPYQRPKWFSQLVFDSESEKLSFIEIFEVVIQSPNFPFVLIKPLYLYQWHQVLQKRAEYEPFELTTISAELQLFWEYYGTLSYKLPFKKHYELLLSMPATWLGYYAENYYNGRIQPKSALYDDITALTFDEVMGLVELAKKAKASQNLDYLEIGVPLLHIIESSWVEVVVEEFIEEILPLILEKTEIEDSSNKNLLRIWFQLWFKVIYPELYLGNAFEQIELKEGQAFQQFLDYLPKIFWVEAEKFELVFLYQIGSGGSIRKLFPYSLLTKRMAHLVTTMEMETAYICRFTWSYLFACTDNYEFSDFICDRLGVGQGWSEEKYHRLKKVEPWILKLRQWFPKITRNNILSLREFLSYFNHCLQEGIDFDIKGRTFASMTRLVEQWHIENRQRVILKGLSTKTWNGAEYEEWQQLVKGDFYQITQLTQAKDLLKEGALMRHCVGTYARKCINGYSSIWSLRMQNKAKDWVSLVTIEIDKSHTIIQTRKKYNGNPEKKYRDMIRAWVDREGINW